MPTVPVSERPPREIWGYRDGSSGVEPQPAFDQFTIEQLAGEPPPESDGGPAHRHGLSPQYDDAKRRRHERTRNFRNAAVIDRVNTRWRCGWARRWPAPNATRTSFDPITQHEYFSVYAILNQSADADRKDETPVHSFFTPDQKAKRALLEKEIAISRKRFTSPDPGLAQRFGNGMRSSPPRSRVADAQA